MTQLQNRWLAIVAVALIAAAATPAGAIRLDDTAIYIEINDTDGDAGIQIFLDGEGWDTMQVIAPNGNVVMGVAADGNVGSQGITELFLESAEPSFDEQPLADFLELFPPGVYRFIGRTTEGARLLGGARLTHRIPEAPEILSPEEEGTLPIDDAVIEWTRVPNPGGSPIRAYEVVIETEEPQLRVLKADMGNRQTSLRIPPEFLRRGKTFKVEVIAIEKSGNRTISEVEFDVE